MGNVSEMAGNVAELSVAIHQPNFLPWVGYFDKIARVDTFVLFDDVQLPQGKSFCSRVKIKGSNGPQWLTVPVSKKSKALINQVEIVQNGWARKHTRTIESLYGKAPYFAKFWPAIRATISEDWVLLADMNCALIETISRLVGIETNFVRSSTFDSDPVSADERILSILKSTNAAVYVSGEGAGSRRYVQCEEMAAEGVRLAWQDFQHPVYSQLAEPFDSHMSVLDMMFMAGSVLSESEKRERALLNEAA
ncbi:MAG: WbqC family protein [Planctomycetales bacterium]|jgi:hypothetical protein